MLKLPKRIPCLGAEGFASGVINPYFSMEDRLKTCLGPDWIASVLRLLTTSGVLASGRSGASSPPKLRAPLSQGWALLQRIRVVGSEGATQEIKKSILQE